MVVWGRGRGRLPAEGIRTDREGGEGRTGRVFSQTEQQVQKLEEGCAGESQRRMWGLKTAGGQDLCEALN